VGSESEPAVVRILLLSPFHGHSSHAAWAKGWRCHSRHEIEVLSLPDRAWSWRLKGSSVPLARCVESLDGEFDLIVATSLTCLSSFFGLVRHTTLVQKPAIYYMHENQLTYPIRPGGKRDSQLVLRQFHAQLTAEEIWFNSDYHRQSWFRALPKFLRNFPDHQGLEWIEGLQAKAQVVPLGLELSAPLEPRTPERPILVWNQRWEWEKGIDRFVELIRKFAPDPPFDVVLLGGERQEDPLRREVELLLGSRLIHRGWCEREEYESWMRRGSFTVSVARHEFFGISLLEAAANGMQTFLPHDLAYPEIIPPELHSSCLYRSQKALFRLVKDFLAKPEAALPVRQNLQDMAQTYDWRKLAHHYDDEAERVISRRVLRHSRP
jgi:glycosyltransferase involved in cell wall biosynthesis